MNHRDQVLALLHKQVSNASEVEDIRKTAEEVVHKWVNPLSGGSEQTNGLIYGLVQSGKTGVLTVTGAMGADEGYRTIIILTSDIDPLYEQTLGRAQEAFPGMDILGKKDIRDIESFLLYTGPTGRRNLRSLGSDASPKLSSTKFQNSKCCLSGDQSLPEFSEMLDHPFRHDDFEADLRGVSAYQIRGAHTDCHPQSNRLAMSRTTEVRTPWKDESPKSSSAYPSGSVLEADLVGDHVS